MTSFYKPSNHGKIFHVQHRLANSISPTQPLVTGAWLKRELNTVRKNTITGASLAADVMTLPAGQYLVRATSQFYRTLGSQSRLRDTTNGIDLELSSVGYFYNATGADMVSPEFHGVIDLGAETDIELQSSIASLGSGKGWGLAAGRGVGEVYCQVMYEAL